MLALPLALLAFACFPVFASDYALDVAFFFGIYTLLGLSLNEPAQNYLSNGFPAFPGKRKQ